MLAAIGFYWSLSVIEKHAQERLHLHLNNIANTLSFYYYYFFLHEIYWLFPGAFFQAWKIGIHFDMGWQIINIVCCMHPTLAGIMHTKTHETACFCL